MTIKEPERPPSPQPTVEIYMRDPSRLNIVDIHEHSCASSGTASRSDRGCAWDKISIRLVGSHPLWGHHLWAAARCFASYLDTGAEYLCVGKNVLELGAGGALPGIVSALLGARKVVLTDYPDASLLDNISYNVAENIPQERHSCVSVQGYIWGQDPTSLIDALRGPDEEDGETNRHKFDLLILSDLMFNHAAHDALLDTCAKTLSLTVINTEDENGPFPGSAKGPPRDTQTPTVLVFYTHHRPWLAHRDLEFFRKARKRGWICDEFFTERTGPMFPDDPGDFDVRSTVHGWRLYRGSEGILEKISDEDE